MMPEGRAVWAALAAIIGTVGLTFRLGHWGLPLAVHHIGGGLLWGAMLYVVGAAARPSSWRRTHVAAAALLIVLGVEGGRLVRTPALDQFRLTLVGQLLLGRLFNVSNIAVDGLGIGAAWLATSRLRWSTLRQSSPRRCGQGRALLPPHPSETSPPWTRRPPAPP